MYEKFRELLSHRNPRFLCHCAGDRQKQDKEEHWVAIGHEISSPLPAEELTLLQEQFGELPELIEFYRHWGSAALFQDSMERASGVLATAFYIAPPSAWAELKEVMELWLEMLADDERAEFAEWLEDYVVIGEIPNSGNYFFVPLQGEHRGKVVEFEHDGFEFFIQGTTMVEFIDHISTVTAKLLKDIGCHTRYTDGKTERQWRPVAYQHD